MCMKTITLRVFFFAFPWLYRWIPPGNYYILNEMKSHANPVCKKSGHNTEFLKKKETQYQRHTDKNYAIILKHVSNDTYKV